MTASRNSPARTAAGPRLPEGEAAGAAGVSAQGAGWPAQVPPPARRRRRGSSALTCLAALGFVLPLSSAARARGGRQNAPRHAATIRRRVNEVLADFVVVNRQGAVVRGLKPDEIEVFDNGVRQRVESLRFVTRSVRLRPQNWRAIGLKAPAVEPPSANLTAVVFDPIDNQGEPAARRAAVQLVADELGPGVYMAVFRRGRRLVLLQPFTNDPAALDRAIRRATSRAAVRINYQREIEEYRAMLAAFSGGGRGGRRVAATAKAATLPYWLGASVPVVTNIFALGAMVNAARVNEIASGMQRVRRQMADLRRLVALLAPFDGRKSVVLFTQRLYMRNGLEFIFRALIREANRATVSFYPVDTGGLSTRPDLAALATALRGPTYGVERGAPVEPDAASAVDDSQAVILGELAAATGGMAVTDTNDPSRFMAHIAAQSASHYEVAFMPRGFVSGKVLARHVVVIRMLGHQHWRVDGRKVYYARFGSAP